MTVKPESQVEHHVENIQLSACEEQSCAVGIWGRGLIPRDLRDSPAVDQAFRLKLQNRLVLELLVGSFTGSKTDTMKNIFGHTHR
jgi:hypothetical protein